MIAQMKKVSIVLLDSDKQDSLKSLKKAGLMHLTENFGSSDDVKAVEENIKEVEGALRYTDESSAAHDRNFDQDEVFNVVQQVNELGKELSALQEQESKYNRDLEFLEPWGEFNPSDLKYLEEKGIKITLVELNKDQMHHLTDNVNYFQISHTNLGFLLAIIGECPEGITEFEPPELGIEDTLGALELVLNDIDKINDQLKELSSYHGLMLQYIKILEDKLEFEQVKAGMGYDENFSVLEGWVEAAKEDKFKATAAKKGWGVAFSDPVEGDETPTLLKGNGLTKIIHPLLDFLGNVPGYWEKDVSAFFLVFFTIFFAMIIGDAGYGLVFIGLTLLAQIKMKKINDALKLFYLLSGATVVWGAITGNWFGSALISGIPFFNGLIVEQLQSGETVKELCFNIAVVHLVLARLTALIKEVKTGKIAGVAHLGWLLATIGLLFIVKNLVLSPVDFPIPGFALILIAIGFGIVLIFGNQEPGQSFGKGLGMGLAFSPLTALDTVGEFGNIISYVRLYAVGLAGFAVAQSFNGMAAPLIQGGGVGYVGGALILLAGHAFNIGMAALSVLVHGVRLNVLEFSSAADVNWTGIKFNPFREKEII